MKEFLKHWKTTLIAVVGLLLGLSTFIFWYLGKIDNDGLTLGLAGIATFTTILGNLFAKDYDKSHTQK